jgi:hypothetical protein
MRLLLFLLAALVAVPVLADNAEAGPSSVVVSPDVAITIGAGAPVAPVIDQHDAVIVQDVLHDVVDVITNHRNVSALAVVALAITLLVRLSKLGVLSRFLASRQLTWVRPLLALLLGIAGAVATTLQQGRTSAADLLSAALGGALAGLVGVGTHEVARLASSSERAKVRVDDAAVDQAAAVLEDRAVAAQVDAGKRVRDAQDAVASTVSLPAAKRVEALAGLLKGGR